MQEFYDYFAGLDYRVLDLFGLDAGAHHAVGLALHVANALLLRLKPACYWLMVPVPVQTAALCNSWHSNWQNII